MGVPPQRLLPVLVLPLLLGCQNLWPMPMGTGVDSSAAEPSAEVSDVSAAPERMDEPASDGSVDDGIFDDGGSGWSDVASPTYGAHRVQRGETLYSISRRYGTSVAELASSNGLADPTALRSGVTLRVPRADPSAPALEPTEDPSSAADGWERVEERLPGAPTPVGGAAREIGATPERIRHVVRPGETLWRIARLYEVTPVELAHANGISDVGALSVGASLEVPRTVTARAVPAESAGCDVLPDVAASPPPAPVYRTASASAEEVYEAIDSVLELGDRYLDSARFEETIDLAGLGLELLGEHWTDESSGPRIARAELMRGIAQVALERRHEGHASFRRALRVEPRIVLGPEASPKIVDVFEAAREEVDAALASAARP